MTAHKNAPAAGGNQREGEIAIHPIPEENPNMDTVPNTPCQHYNWCQGHDSLFPEADGVHSAVLALTASGERTMWISHTLPTDEFPDPSRPWEVLMPDGSDWKFAPEEADAEIADAIDELLRARVMIHDFMTQVAS